ncbi:MAG: FtsX-like permease family protein, partial [Eubacteriales bacterium]
YTDFLYSLESGKTGVFRANLLNETINQPSLVYGRLPQNDNEVIADARFFGENDIGKIIKIADENTDYKKDIFKYDEYIIVGIADSVYYMNIERGTTSLGGGSISGFVYMTRGALDFDYYTEIFLTLDKKAYLFSDEYNENIEAATENIEKALKERADIRYESVISDIKGEIEKAKAELSDAENKYLSSLTELETKKDELSAAEAQYNALVASGAFPEEALDKMKAEIESGKALILSYENELSAAKDAIDVSREAIASSEDALSSFDAPLCYALTRDTNTGYVCFESDTKIVDGIARIFPLFFFLVAALVCMTTMTRMVEEQRTQIGTLKALGYTNGNIVGKYIFYSGSAAMIGCISGFFFGTWIFPAAIWKAYGMLYGFAEIKYLFSPSLALISIIASLACSALTTYISVRKELMKMPAELMRPKAPKPGKRIILERITPIWKRMKFLHKVSARNIVRYKKRMFMMILGIGGCTALVVTGFGIRDSISKIAEDQYDNILKYDYAVTFNSDADKDFTEKFLNYTDHILSEAVFVKESSAMVRLPDGTIKKINLIATSDPDIEKLIDLHNVEKHISYPGKNEAVVTEKFASQAGIAVGDVFSFTVDNTKTFNVTVTGICENYVYNYIYINGETYEDAMGEEMICNALFAKAKDGTDKHEVAAEIMSLDGVSNITVSEDLRARVSNMMLSLDYIVWLVIASAGMLAFIVLFNLNNINITERVREIATIKVLGFSRKEVTSYVFRESIVLTLIGALIGLPLGYFLHSFVMSQINIDLVSFNVHIAPLSYVFAVALTFVFAFIVEIFIKKKTDKIDMADSLKSIE